MAGHFYIRKNPNSQNAGQGIAEAVQAWQNGQVQAANQQTQNLQNLMRMQMMGRDIQNQDRAFAQQEAERAAGAELGKLVAQNGLDNPETQNAILSYFGQTPIAMDFMNLSTQAQDRAYRKEQDRINQSQEWARINQPKQPKIQEFSDGYGGKVYGRVYEDGRIEPVDTSALFGNQQMPTQQAQQTYTVQDVQNQLGLGGQTQPNEQQMIEAANSLGANIPTQQTQAQPISSGMVVNAMGEPLQGIDVSRLQPQVQSEMFIDGKPYYVSQVRTPQGNAFLIGGEVPKSAQERKAEQELEKQAGAQALATRQADLVLGGLDEASQLAKQGQLGGMVNNTGMGSLLNFIPGTAGNDLEKTLDTIKSNVGFDYLQQMRANSPTGGALGSVTERELALLQSTIASLDTSQSQEQFLRNLEKVKQVYNQIVHGSKQPQQQRMRFNPQTGGFE